MALNPTNSSNMEQLALEGLIRISCAIACKCYCCRCSRVSWRFVCVSTIRGT